MFGQVAKDVVSPVARDVVVLLPRNSVARDVICHGILYSTAVTLNVNVLQSMTPPLFSLLPLLDQTVIAG